MGKSTKKVKPIKVRKPMDPQTKRKLQRTCAHATGVLCLVILCGVGLFHMRRHVERKLTYPAGSATHCRVQALERTAALAQGTALSRS